MGSEPESVQTAEGKGLHLLQRRVSTLFGDTASLTWQTSPGKGFSALLRLPISEARSPCQATPFRHLSEGGGMKDPDGFGIAKVLICEDEPLAVRALREYLKDVDWIEVVGDARNGPDAVRLIQKTGTGSGLSRCSHARPDGPGGAGDDHAPYRYHLHDRLRRVRSLRLRVRGSGLSGEALRKGPVNGEPGSGEGAPGGRGTHRNRRGPRTPTTPLAFLRGTEAVSSPSASIRSFESTPLQGASPW